MKLQPHDFGWIAGTLDLKGVVVRKNNKGRKTPQIVLLVETKERSVVKRLAKYTGTDPAQQTQRKIKEEWSRRGCVEHCPAQHVHIQEVSMPPISRWQVTGSSLAVVVYNVMPYLTDCDKTRKMRDAMEEIGSTITLEGQGRAAIDAAIKRLTNLGWDIPSYLLAEPQEELF